MATIFITGITGFVGKQLAKQFAFEGHSVFGSSYTAEDKQSIKLDIRIFKEVLEAFQHIQPDIVIHSAALSSVTQGRTMEYYESNVLGTENVIEALNSLGGRRRLVFLSTAGVYGNQATEILSEELNLKPVSHYGMSKLVCERMLANSLNQHDITIFRPFNIIGAGQNSSFIVPKLVQHFAERKKSIRLGNLDPVRDYIDIETCCNIIFMLTFNVRTYGETINLCSGRGTSVRELLVTLESITGHEIEVIAAPEFIRKTEVWKLLGCVKKLDGFLPQKIISKSKHEVLQSMLDAALI